MTVLLVLQVVSGTDVIQALSSLPFAKPRDSWYDKPYFEAGGCCDTLAPLQVTRYAGPALLLKSVLSHAAASSCWPKTHQLLATETNSVCLPVVCPLRSAGKMIGDKRATVAEKRFNRPLKRVLVGNAGVMN